MPFAAGSRLGAYEITGVLGSGAMGEVYRARDVKLGREVALKVLPEAFASDPERLARFEREAQALAALNHPHIAQIYGVIDLPPTGGSYGSESHAIVMELVTGEDLAARIERGPMRSSEALPLIRQIADALDAAHERGIVHRDLKPANIRVRPDGVVKVLDFGLATAIATAPIGTTFSGVTTPGVIMGTPSYMSPEQARGLAIDARSDIFALGCIAFEMLTGRRAFPGSTASDILVALLDRPPDWGDAQLSPFERRLIVRCLEKDPKRRFHDAGDICLAIDDAVGEVGETPPRVSGLRLPLVAAVGALMLVVGAAAGYVLTRGNAASGLLASRIAVPIGSGTNLEVQRCPTFALSPDGTQLAFIATRAGRSQLFLRGLNDLDAHPVRGGEGAGDTVLFSPDGKWLAFFLNDRLQKIPVTGGTPTSLVTRRLCGGDWTTDDRIVWGSREGILDVPASGGSSRQVIAPSANGEDLAMYSPQLLPDGRTYIFTLSSGSDLRIVAQRAGSTERTVLVERGNDATYVRGRLVYADAGSIFSVPFDPSTLKVTGVPVTIADGVVQLEAGVTHVSVSRDGRALAYVPGDAFSQPTRSVLTFDQHGTSRPLGVPAGPYVTVRLSPDGTKVALEKPDAAKNDIWIYDFARATLTPLTRDGDNRLPIWSPDSQRVFFTSNRTGGSTNLYVRRLDGVGGDIRLSTTANVQMPADVSRDGRWLVYVEVVDFSRLSIRMLPLDAQNASSREYAASHFSQRQPAISPDGRWLAYWSAETTPGEIFVGAFPDPGPTIQVSSGGGQSPAWSRDGRQLFYRSGSRIMAVDITGGRTLNASRPRELFDDKGGTVGLEVAPDGRFITVSAPPPPPPLTRLNVLLDWADRE